MPPGQEPRERLLLDGLDLAAKRSERRATQTAKHVRVAPLALAAAGTKLAAHELLVALELRQHVDDVAAEALVRLRRRERAAALRVSKHELAQRLRAAFEKRIGQPRRRHRAERVAVAARILGRDQPLVAGEANEQRATLREQRLGERRVVFAAA